MPTKPLPWNKILPLSAAFICFLAAPVALAALQGASAIGILAVVVFMVLLFVLALLGALFPVVDRRIKSFFATWLWFCGCGIITLGPLAAFYRLSQLLVQLSLWVQIITLVAWGLLLACMLLLIATASNRERMFEWLRKLGLFAPFVYSFNVLGIALVYFSVVTYVLANHGFLEFGESVKQEVTFSDLLDLYIWHFLDAIPSLKVNETLRWEKPLTYDNAGLGLVLLLFKLTVIAPVIAAFAGYWKHRRHGEEEKEDHPEERTGQTI